MRRRALVLALVAATAPALAAPKGKTARAHFNRGVAAYTKGDFAAAAAAFAKSNSIESDEETLFAWAQTERKLGRCKKAIELYTKLLALKLPEANKKVIRTNVDECEAILLAEDPAPPPRVDPQPAADPDPRADARSDTRSDARSDARGEEPGTRAITEPAPAPAVVRAERRPWFKDPLGGVLVGAGIVSLGVGTVFLVQANSLDADKTIAQTYDEYIDLADRAESKGRIGVIASIAGGALILGGVIRYATAGSGSEDRKTVSGWIAPSGGGLVLGGRW